MIAKRIIVPFLPCALVLLALAVFFTSRALQLPEQAEITSDEQPTPPSDESHLAADRSPLSGPPVQGKPQAQKAIVVHVLDQPGGFPVVGATVMLLNAHGKSHADAETDASGTARVTFAPGCPRILVYCSGYAAHLQDSPPTPTLPQTVRLSKCARIRGTVSGIPNELRQFIRLTVALQLHSSELQRALRSNRRLLRLRTSVVVPENWYEIDLPVVTDNFTLIANAQEKTTQRTIKRLRKTVTAFAGQLLNLDFGHGPWPSGFSDLTVALKVAPAFVGPFSLRLDAHPVNTVLAFTGNTAHVLEREKAFSCAPHSEYTPTIVLVGLGTFVLPSFTFTGQPRQEIALHQGSQLTVQVWTKQTRAADTPVTVAFCGPAEKSMGWQTTILSRPAVLLLPAGRYWIVARSKDNSLVSNGRWLDLRDPSVSLRVTEELQPAIPLKISIDRGSSDVPRTVPLTLEIADQNNRWPAHFTGLSLPRGDYTLFLTIRGSQTIQKSIHVDDKPLDVVFRLDRKQTKQH